jgi:hypothetical protein
MRVKRITVFAGHYGSGKTTLTLSYAAWLRAAGYPVVVCDMDVVNPYFKAAAAGEFLAGQGIGLVASPLANTTLDAPATPAAFQSVFDDPHRHAVLDLGGDDRGALALGRYAKFFDGAYEMLLVVNCYRPLTRDADSLLAMRAEIEEAARVRFTGLVNNSNLGPDTTPADLLATQSTLAALSARTSLPLKMTAARRGLGLTGPGYFTVDPWQWGLRGGALRLTGMGDAL